MKLSILLLVLFQLSSSSGRLHGAGKSAEGSRVLPPNKRVRRDDDGEADAALEEAQDRGLQKATRIIGGGLSDEGEYPYAVSLNGGGRHFCGGSLIAPDVVLSAA